MPHICLKSGGKLSMLPITTKPRHGCLFQRPGPGVRLQILACQRITPVFKIPRDHKTIESCTWNSISRGHGSQIFLMGWTIGSICSHSVPKKTPVTESPSNKEHQGICPRCCVVKKPSPFSLFTTKSHSNSSYFSFVMQDVIKCDL